MAEIRALGRRLVKNRCSLITLARGASEKEETPLPGYGSTPRRSSSARASRHRFWCSIATHW